MDAWQFEIKSSDVGRGALPTLTQAAKVSSEPWGTLSCPFLSFHKNRSPLVQGQQVSSQLRKSYQKNMVVLLLQVMCQIFTTRTPRPVSAMAPTLPVYIWKLEKYPLLLSPSTHTFMPRLMGFIGIYCSREEWLVNLNIASLIATSCALSTQTWIFVRSDQLVGVLSLASRVMVNLVEGCRPRNGDSEISPKTNPW